MPYPRRVLAARSTERWRPWGILYTVRRGPQLPWRFGQANGSHGVVRPAGQRGGDLGPWQRRGTVGVTPTLGCKELQGRMPRCNRTVHAEMILKGNWLVSPWANPMYDSSTWGSATLRSSPPSCCGARWRPQGCIGIPSLRRKVCEKTRGTPRPAKCLNPPSNETGPPHFR